MGCGTSTNKNVGDPCRQISNHGATLAAAATTAVDVMPPTSNARFELNTVASDSSRIAAITLRDTDEYSQARGQPSVQKEGSCETGNANANLEPTDEERSRTSTQPSRASSPACSPTSCPELNLVQHTRPDMDTGACISSESSACELLDCAVPLPPPLDVDAIELPCKDPTSLPYWELQSLLPSSAAADNVVRRFGTSSPSA